MEKKRTLVYRNRLIEQTRKVNIYHVRKPSLFNVNKPKSGNNNNRAREAK